MVVVFRYRCGPASQPCLEMEKLFAAFGGALNKFGQEIKCDLNLFDWYEVIGRPSNAPVLSLGSRKGRKRPVMRMF